MATFTCEFCGETFEAKPSAHRKFCSKKCAGEARKGEKRLSKKVEVVCAECGKIELVPPSRAKKYLCCSVECLAKYNSKRYSKKIDCTCPICGKEFKLKPYRFNRVLTTPCCSRECANKLKETTYLGECNHQFGLKGELNASFKGSITTKTNNKLMERFVHCPNRPDSNRDGRITEHRLKVLENCNLYDPCFFIDKDGYKIFNPDEKLKISVHHINGNHLDNTLSNLIPLTRSKHKSVHNYINKLDNDCIHSIIGVLKQGELLENPEVDNQQPSLDSNILDGSETNSQIQTSKVEDGNADTSALLNNIKDIIDDYIVQTRKIAERGYEESIKEILESEIKSSEISTNGL